MLIFPDFGAILQINTYCIFCDANVAKETEHEAVEVMGGEQKKKLLQLIINMDSSVQRFEMCVCCLLSSTFPWNCLLKSSSAIARNAVILF